MFLQQFANALALGSVYALFALGFTLIFGVLEVITLAHGAVFMIGAFAGLTVVTKFNASPVTAILAGMMASGVIGWLIDLAAVRPLRKRKFHHLAPMIATIGCATIITSISQGIFGAEIYRFPFDFMPATSYNFWAVQLTLLQIIIVSVALFLMMIIIFLLNKTKWGKAVRSVAESPRTSALLGFGRSCRSADGNKFQCHSRFHGWADHASGNSRDHSGRHGRYQRRCAGWIDFGFC